ncbi:Translation initiation factor 3 subunit J component [Myotisia sp. PD_48]|nr:Translation initiation factor 3 subunit J component [Myotisia sp. PD_48]
MAPSKWDDEEESTPPSSPPLIARRKFEDEEDDSDDVLESWDAAEDSEVEREKEAKKAAAKAKADAEALASKKSKSQRIAEYQEAARLRREAGEDSSDDEEEDLATQRERLRKTEQDADLKHAQDLLDNIDLNRMRNRTVPMGTVIADNNDPTKSIDLSALPLLKPTTKRQFTALTETLVPLLTLHSKKAPYSLWLQDFAKQLAKDLPSQEIKKVASALTAASNEKLKEEKASEKGGKKTKAAKTKATLVGARETRGADTNTYEEDFGDDDFM